MVRAVSCAPKSLRGRKICPTASRSPRGRVPGAPHLVLEEADRDLHVDPRPVAGLAVRIDRAAVPDRAQRLDAGLDHLPPRRPVDRHDQPDAAGVMLLLAVIQPLRLQPRVLRLHAGDPGSVVSRHGVTPGWGGRAAGLKGKLADLAAFLKEGGRPRLPERYRKRRVTIMLDPDVIEHFKAEGRGWQIRVNAALRKAAGL